MSENEIHPLVQQRLDKAEELRQLGMNPYANDFKPEITCAEYHRKYDAQDKASLAELNNTHTLAGRIMGKRLMGKACFLRILDRSGEVQLFIKKDRIGETNFQLLKMTDLGDFIGVAGTPMKTKTGELSVATDAFRILTKAIHPLPDKFHGLQNTEMRYRQRYVDLVMNKDARHIFKTRSMIVREIRNFLDARDFMEVETPILNDSVGGASARPFTTHHNTLDMPLTMRIATELHLKRLVVGGFERVYEIGRLFRNEGVSTKHNPEFTSIEFYQAYAVYEDLMQMTEEMIHGLVTKIHGCAQTQFGGKQIDFSRPWRKAPIATLVSEHLKIEDQVDISSVEKALEIAVGHTVTEDSALITVLKELSDEEAVQLIPGMMVHQADVSTMGVVAVAKIAMTEVGDGFYQQLGEAIDQAWVSPEDTVTPKNTQQNEQTQEGESVRIHSITPVDEKWERRRRLALHILYDVFDAEIEETLINPTFITDFSVSESPLARKRDGDPAVADRFELIVAGMEIANAFNELNDPVDQKERFMKQGRDKERGDQEAHGIDEDFVHALEIGMPPTAGEGIGIDRLTMLLTNQESIREVILFPLLKKADS